MRFLRWLARWQCEGYGGWTPMFPALVDWLARRDAANLREMIAAGHMDAVSFGFRKRS